jgi:D-inositol-3-phosphate glycosyltransferase
MAAGMGLGVVSALRTPAAVWPMPDDARESQMFGMAAVEAQACGKPVVASDHGGLRETVPDTGGSRFRTGDAADLAAHVDALLGSPDSLGALGAGARENARRYDWPRIAARCQEVYATL